MLFSLYLCRAQLLCFCYRFSLTLSSKYTTAKSNVLMIRELGKTKQILHVRGLLDGLNGLLVAQILHMLHY